MKLRNLVLIVSVILMTCMAAGSALAEGQASSKATVAVGQISFLEASKAPLTSDSGFVPILASSIKTANGKDLFIDVSLECGLYTMTKVDSLAGIEDRADAVVGVEIRVVVDPGTSQERIAEPGPVNFCRRSQVLKAEFQGLLEDADGNSCLSVDPEGSGSVFIDEDCLQPETLELILDTMSANSFNFLLPNLDTGIHDVVVEAKIDSFIDSTLDSGTKVKDQDDSDSDGGDLDETDTVLTTDKEGFFEAGQLIVIDDEEMLILAVDGRNLDVERGMNETLPAWHPVRSRIYIVAGAEASASIGKGSVTVEEIRLVKDGIIDM